MDSNKLHTSHCKKVEAMFFFLPVENAEDAEEAYEGAEPISES